MNEERHTSGAERPRATHPRAAFRDFTWLVGGRVFRLGTSLVVGAWVARYLAPAEFGQLSYMISVVAFFSALAGAGLDGLIVRDLFTRQRAPGVTLCTSMALKGGIGLLLYLCLVLGWCGLQGGGVMLWMVVFLGVELLMQSGSVFDQYFQARLANKWSVMAGIVAVAVSSAVRVGLILSGASLCYFAAAVPLESGVLVACFMAIYLRQRSAGDRWHFSFRDARDLLRESWPMVVSAAAIAGCMRADQIMLKSLSGEASVGIYAAAVRLSEVWYFVPVFIGTALNPWILEGCSIGGEVYRRRLVRLYSWVFWASLVIAGTICALASPIIHALYGDAYAAAVAPLRIHVAGGVFLAWGVACGKWYIADGHTLGLMFKALFGLVINLVGNLLLIPRYGVCGAATAAVVGHFAANVLYDVLDPRVRPQLALKLRALWAWEFRQS